MNRSTIAWSKTSMGVVNDDCPRKIIEIRWKISKGCPIQPLCSRSQTVYGETHPSTLETMDQLASTLMQLDRHKEAQELCERILEIRKQTLGLDHFLTAFAMIELGCGIYGSRELPGSH